MKIILSPVRTEEKIHIVRAGDVLTINGGEFDFSEIGEGDTLPREAINSIWFAGPVERIDGQLVLTLLLPNPWNYSQEQAFPVPLENVPNGPVILPAPLPVQLAEVGPEDGQ